MSSEFEDSEGEHFIGTEELKHMGDVWVCENCRTAACWAGIFLCDAAIMRTAGVVRQSKRKCAELKREHKDYYNRPEVQIAPDDTRKRL